jgi:hypothetical protein
MELTCAPAPAWVLMAAKREHRYQGPDRRRAQQDYPGPERRDNGRERFLLIRDAVLVGVGTVGIMAVTVAALFVGIKDSAVALAALATFGGLLGLPTIARFDERRRNGR